MRKLSGKKYDEGIWVNVGWLDLANNDYLKVGDILALCDYVGKLHKIYPDGSMDLQVSHINDPGLEHPVVGRGRIKHYKEMPFGFKIIPKGSQEYKDWFAKGGTKLEYGVRL